MLPKASTTLMDKTNLDVAIAGPSHASNVYEDPDQLMLPKASTTLMDKTNLDVAIAGPSHASNVYKHHCYLIENKENIIETSSNQTVAQRKRQNSFHSMPENKLYSTCKNLMKSVANLRSKLKAEKRRANVIKVLYNNDNVIKLLSKKISPSMALMLQGDIENGKRRLRGRRWTKKQKVLALEMYKKSPTTYKLLRRLFCLPAATTLRNLLRHFELNPGINEVIFSRLKKYFAKYSNEENLCSLTFDEMSIRKHLCYNSKKNQIDGYQDHGSHGRSEAIASHALVFMLVGMRRRWKQPVAFYFSGDYVTADRLTILIKEVLHQCLKAGARVEATVCDMDGVNVKAIANLGSTIEKPFFEFEGVEIVTLPDPPHLLKCFRNMLMKYDVEIPLPLQSRDNNSMGTGVASWRHIETFFELDNINPHFVFAPVLSKRHIQPNGKEKMRVKLAAQIFSHSVAMGIFSKASTNELPAGAVATATFLEQFNNLFDLINADAPDRQGGKPFKTNMTKKSPHLKMFAEAKIFITKLKFLGCRSRPPSHWGWLKLLNGYERLWENLTKKYRVKSLATRRISQDPLENSFGCIRANCGSNDNPTVTQFIAGLKTSIVANLRNCTKSTRNCEDDNNEVIENFNHLFSKNEIVKETSDLLDQGSSNVSAQTIHVSDEEIESSGETQACAYVCGFIFKKYAKDCVCCKKAMLAEKTSDLHIFTEFKEYTDGKHSLQYANVRFIACVEKCAELTNNFIKKNRLSGDMKTNCIKIIRENVNFSFLNDCVEHLSSNIKMIEQSVTIILLKRFCLLENRRFAQEASKKILIKKIKILKNT